jgi:hypothetical protein
MINDIPPDDLPTTPDPSGMASGDLFDVFDDAPQQEAVLPPLDVEVMDETTREIGYPEELSEYWHYQGQTQDCALYSQGGILDAEGQPMDIQKYEQQGIDGGWYTPEEGTFIPAFGELLNENGVPANLYEGANIQDLAGELAEGRGVVAAVDTQYLWGQPGGHALWVTGMEVGPDGVPTSVICNDSGREDGQACSYPLDQFLPAWSLYGNIMVSTDRTLSVLS